MPHAENWLRAYHEAPEIFDAFSRAEDPDGRVVRALRVRAELAAQTVLEVGCGTGRYTRELAPDAARFVAVERSAPMLALAAGHGTGAVASLVCARAEQLPLADGSVDRAVAAWVLINLAPSVRRAVLAEIGRVLRRAPGCGLWLVENHWSGEFQALRGRRADVDEQRVRQLIAEHGFTLDDVVETELRFSSAAEAERVLGYLCGDPVRERLRDHPTHRLTHHVVILHRPSTNATRTPGGSRP